MMPAGDVRPTDAGGRPGEDWEAAGFGIYLHWPFCASKCPYCDFNSHVSAGIDQRAWRDAYRSEIARVAALTPGRTVSTVFFGGGTPSLMEPELVAGILSDIRAGWTVAEDAEVTLEANPGSAEAGRFRGYRAAGVNRLSLGVQSLRDADLRRLGRLHDAREARAALEMARDTFPRMSFDLIYARQDQTEAAWREELGEALALAADHLSVYQLTIEPGTPFAARRAAGGLRGLPDEDWSADMYLITQEILSEAGLPAYEVSNHSRPGSEGRHNLIYWRSGDFAGIGPGAHGRLTLGGRRWATETARMPGDWLDRVRTAGSGESGRDEVPPEEQAEEYLMMGLRLSEGIDLARYARLNGAPVSQSAVADLEGLGLVEATGGRLRATGTGRAVLDSIIAALAAG